MSVPAITCDAILTGIRTRSDNSLGLSLSTPELQPTEQLAFLQIRGKNIKVLFQPVDTPPAELVTVKSDLEQKSPSQRLRAVLFVAFRQQQEEKSFDVFYAAAMNRIIDQIKATLEPAQF